MIRQLVFATHNEHKTDEVRALLSGQYEVLNLQDIGCTEDIAETGDTFSSNALLKSSYVYENYHMDCFADDSGLEVAALNDEPGVLSARYSGARGDAANMMLVLEKMEGEEDRRAQFRTVISLLSNGERFFFEGRVQGTLRERPTGDGGFGYDPIFQPDGYSKTFAEMTMAEKNAISHRAIAMRLLINFLREQTS